MDGPKMKYKEMNLNIFQKKKKKNNNIITLEGGGLEKNQSNLKQYFDYMLQIYG